MYDLALAGFFGEGFSAGFRADFADYADLKSALISEICAKKIQSIQPEHP